MKFAIFSNVQQKRNPEFGTDVRSTDRDTLANEGTVAPEELPPGERLRYLVREAELEVTSAGAVFEEIELL